MSRFARVLVLCGVVAVLPVSGCGGGSGSSSTHAPAVAKTATTPPTSPPATTTSIPSTNGAPTAVLPANFVLNADGSLSPRLVAGPGGTTVELTVTSKAGHPVTVSAASHSLTVPPGGRASARLAGLRTGRHSVDVDGRPRAVLLVGAQPGP